MPDATITSTASTFGTISGTFLADQSTITGTVSGNITGTLDGSVGVPGPQGPTGPTGPQGPAGPSVWGGITGTLSTQTDLQTALNLKADLASPALTGNPTGPTAALGDNDTSLATTAFVQQELASGVAVAKNLEVYVRNQTGSTLTAGTIVYINGATGNRPTVTKAQANNDANSAQTFGFVKTSIANNGFGYVIVRGECENLDTSALTEGAQLYLSPTTAGTWTTTKPSAPQHLVYVGIVVRAHPTQGVILVAIQNGYELNEIHDVSITSPSNGQVLKYDSAQSLWVNGTDSSGVAWGAITGALSSQTDLDTALGLKLPKAGGYITGDIQSSNNSAYRSWDGAYNTTVLKGDLLQLTNSGAGGNSLTVEWDGITFPSGKQTVHYPGTSILSGYATESWVTSQGYITSAALTPYAPLASPALTGTPTAPTASLGTNTTQIATTAFVTAAVPAFATNAQVVTGTSTTTALYPAHAGFLKADPRLRSLSFINLTTVSGSGQAFNTQAQQFCRQVYLGSLAAGRAAYNFGIIATLNAGFGTSTTKADQVDFSKKVWLSGYANMGLGGATSYLGDANTVCRITLGGYSSNTTGEMTQKGIGIKKVGGLSSFVTLTVHNGTTLTNVASTVTVGDGAGIHWLIYSDGTGNVTLYINGTEAATTSAGPTTATTSGNAIYREQVEATTTPAVRGVIEATGGWLYIEG